MALPALRLPKAVHKAFSLLERLKTRKRTRRQSAARRIYLSPF